MEGGQRWPCAATGCASASPAASSPTRRTAKRSTPAPTTPALSAGGDRRARRRGRGRRRRAPRPRRAATRARRTTFVSGVMAPPTRRAAPAPRSAGRRTSPPTGRCSTAPTASYGSVERLRRRRRRPCTRDHAHRSHAGHDLPLSRALRGRRRQRRLLGRRDLPPTPSWRRRAAAAPDGQRAPLLRLAAGHRLRPARAGSRLPRLRGARRRLRCRAPDVVLRCRRRRRFKAGLRRGPPLVLANTTAGGKRTLLIPTIAAADGSQPQWASQMIHDDDAARAARGGDRQPRHVEGLRRHRPRLRAPARRRQGGLLARSPRELAAQLHAKGKTLSFAVGGLVTAKYSHWDYDALSAAADQLHVMGYDYHYLGSHPGPVSPLGWIQQVLAYIDTVGGGGALRQVHPRPAQLRPRRRRQRHDRRWFGSSMDSHQPRRRQLRDDDHAHGVCPLDQRRATIAPGRAPNAPRRRGTSSSTTSRRTRRRWRRRRRQGSAESPTGPSAASPIGRGRRPSFR